MSSLPREEVRIQVVTSRKVRTLTAFARRQCIAQSTSVYSHIVRLAKYLTCNKILTKWLGFLNLSFVEVENLSAKFSL